MNVIINSLKLIRKKKNKIKLFELFYFDIVYVSRIYIPYQINCLKLLHFFLNEIFFINFLILFVSYVII